MEQHDLCDDEEAELERELDRQLAGLGAEDQDAPIQWNAIATPLERCTDTDEDADGEDELQSLQLLQQAVEARDRKCDTYLSELQALVTVPSDTTAKSPLGATQRAYDTSKPSSIDHDLPGGSLSPAGDDVASATLDQTKVRHAVQALQRLVAESRPGTAIAAAGAAGAAVVQLDVHLGATQERHAAWKQNAMLRQQLEEQQRLKREAELQAEETRWAAARAAERAAADTLAMQSEAALAELERAEVQAAREVELLREQQAIEMRRLEAEAEAMRLRVEQQAAAMRAREQAAALLARQLDEQLAQNVWRWRAARRIQAAWLAYKRSAARQQRLEAITRCQAGLRAALARRKARRLRARRDTLNALRNAASSGSPAELQTAAQYARENGLSEAEVAAHVSSTQRQAVMAAAELRQQAEAGNSVGFTAALAAAGAFSHLADEMTSAREAFQARKAAAVATLQGAAAAQPMADVARAADAAAQLGVERTVTAALLASARDRDARARAQLMALAQAVPFSGLAFSAAADSAIQLGLQGDAAAARAVVNKRRRQCAARLVGAAGMDYNTAQDLIAEARELGLGDEAEDAAHVQAAQRDAATATLLTAASHGSPEALNELLLSAGRCGVSQAAQQQARATLEARQQEAEAGLMAAAHGGTLAAYRRARRVAICAGALDGIPAAEAALAERQRRTAGLMVEAVRQLARQEGAWRDAASLARLAAQLPAAVGLDSHEARDQPRPVAVIESPTRQLAVALAGPGVPASAVPAIQTLWNHCLAAQHIELAANVRLALGALRLHALHQLQPTGPDAAAVGDVWLDYWGVPQGVTWQRSHPLRGSRSAPASPETQPDAVVCGVVRHQRLAQEWAKFTAGALSHATRDMQNSSSVWLWPPPLPTAALQVPLLGASQSAMAWAAPETPAAPSARRLPPSASSSGRPLTKAMTAAAAGQAMPLEHVTRLNLGLEQLSDVAGLGSWCPSLQTLHLDSNQLSSLAGLAGAIGMQHLSACTNRLCDLRSLEQAALGGLHTLAVDSNHLTSLEGLHCMPQLEMLSAADNLLASLHGLSGSGRCRAAPIAWVHLVDLNLAGNELTSLQGLGPACTPCLTSLDVSRNRLASLAGLGACTHLRRLDAACNRLAAWPAADVSPLFLLRRLNLAGNQITALGSPAGSLALPPSLEELCLRDNGVASAAGLLVGGRLLSLDLSFNRLERPDTLHALRGCPDLTSLKVNDNPVCNDDMYRATVHGLLPELRELDGEVYAPSRQLQHLAVAVSCSPVLALSHARAARSGVHVDASGAVWAVAAAAAGGAQRPESCNSGARTLRHFITSCHSTGAARMVEHQHAASHQRSSSHSLFVLLDVQAQDIQSTRWRGGQSDLTGADGLWCQAATWPLVSELTVSAPGFKDQRLAATSAMPSAAWGMEDDTITWGTQPCVLQRQLNALHTQQALATVSGGGRIVEGEPMVILGAGFMMRRARGLHAAAAVLQAAWRGLQARRLAAELASKTHQTARTAAAVCLQAAWRARSVRCGTELRAARAAAAAAKALAQQAAAMKEAEERRSAAVVIQAMARGWLVRRRLAAARRAARGRDSPVDDDAFLDGFKDGADILADIESIIAREHIPEELPISQVVHGAGMAPSKPSHPPIAAPAPISSLMASFPALAKAFMAKTGGAPTAALGTPPKPAGALLPPLPPRASPPASTAPETAAAPPSVSTHDPPPLSPEASQAAYSVSIGPAASEAGRHQRHMERLQALMAEWGFKDLATAEAYWRRQQRQLQGATRAKHEMRNRDPNTRLRKLQEKVDLRPKLRPEDVQRVPAAWRQAPLHMQHGMVQAPPGEGTEQGTLLRPVQAPGGKARHALSADATGGGGDAVARKGSLAQQGKRHSNPVLGQRWGADMGQAREGGGGDTGSVISLASAASEPQPGPGASVRMPPLLRTAASVTGGGSGAASGGPTRQPARQLPVVLPQVSGMQLANNWVLEVGDGGAAAPALRSAFADVGKAVPGLAGKRAVPRKAW